MGRFKNWLIWKMGCVPKERHDEVLEEMATYRATVLKVAEFDLQQQRMKILPVFARINLNQLQGRPEATPEYIERELERLIFEQICTFITYKNDGSYLTAQIDVVDRREPYGKNNS